METQKHTPLPWAVCGDPPNDQWYEGRTIYDIHGDRRVADTGLGRGIG